MVKSNPEINKRRESLVRKRQELESYLRYATEMLRSAKNVLQVAIPIDVSYCTSAEFMDSVERSLNKVNVAVNQYIDEAAVYLNKCKDLILQSELSLEDSVSQMEDENDKDEARN